MPIHPRHCNPLPAYGITQMPDQAFAQQKEALVAIKSEDDQATSLKSGGDSPKSSGSSGTKALCTQCRQHVHTHYRGKQTKAKAFRGESDYGAIYGASLPQFLCGECAKECYKRDYQVFGYCYKMRTGIMCEVGVDSGEGDEDINITACHAVMIMTISSFLLPFQNLFHPDPALRANTLCDCNTRATYGFLSDGSYRYCIGCAQHACRTRDGYYEAAIDLNHLQGW